MKISAFIYHKRAEKYSDCQDCFGINPHDKRIAISDGMSQSIFPQWWAKILVDEYLENGHIPQDILPLQKRWQQMLLNEIKRREEEAITNPKRDPWRLKNLLTEKSGAGATLCGLTLGKNEWFCECLGDSCVITENQDHTLTFYTSQVGAFGNNPDYFDSFRTGKGEPIRKPINRNVKTILMVTDPFAELFQRNENNLDFIKARFGELQNLNNHKSFSELVERWRDEFGMHNDDSTLIFISDCADNNFKYGHTDNLDRLCQDEYANLKEPDSSHTAPNCKPHEGEFPASAQEDLDEKKAVKNFRDSFEELILYYKGKRSKTKICSWITSSLKPLIDSLCKS